MCPDNSYPTIQWKTPKPKPKTQSRYFINSIVLLLASAASFFLFIKAVDSNLSQHLKVFLLQYTPGLGGYRGMGRGDPVMILIILSFAFFIASLLNLSKSIKKQDINSQSLESNFNIFSLELHSDYFIYIKNTIQTKIDYKNVISITLENNEAWVTYKIRNSVFTWTSLNQGCFYFSLLNLDKNTFNSFQEIIKRYNPLAVLN